MNDSDDAVYEIKGDDKVIRAASVSSELDEKSTVAATSTNADIDDYISKFLEMSEDARADDQREKQMTLKQGIKTFPKAIAWSLVLSTALIMEGYDTNLLTSFYAYPGFRKKFGDYYSDINDYQIPARWQTGLSMGYQCGQLIGLWWAGVFADKIGYRKTLMPALATSIGLIFIQFFAPNREVLLLSYILLGINWGSYQTITVTYASEIAPASLRVYLTTYVNVCWVFGQLISAGVIKGISNMSDPHAYRIAYAIQWVWPIPILVGVYLAPESPYFLVKKGRLQEAKHSLMRLLTTNPYLPEKGLVVESMVTKIQLIVREEDATNKGASFKECFTGKNFRRTRVSAITWLFQNITGSALMGYSTYFYEQAGLDLSNAFTFSIIQYCLGIIGTFGSWFLSQKLGRFPIFFGGLCTQAVLLLVTGGLGCSSSTGASWGIGSMLLVYTFVYDATVGPMCYCIIPEMPSAQLRQKTVMLSRMIYNISGIVVGILSSYMLNPTEWNWKAKTGFFWAGFAIFAAIWTWFELPETKNRTFAELDKLFEQGVPARKFKYTVPKTFDAGEMMEKLGNNGIKNIINEREHIEYADDELK
ncbi:Mal31 maltose transporter [Candida orthopsilosis Co 90-125]|uniref:Mal31 maltose transporter n=1 Tax=Candida orthopsilosis (strain 90-125) TaxID=1136231 RepID=H8X280_CANO9|nr:Mal31 maltose transporter [Candida orthopsilosis Co 90-125]CCG22802.1 Mal31 maltose transporter [Candida orthopsilosis Co 90-125]